MYACVKQQLSNTAPRHLALPRPCPNAKTHKLSAPLPSTRAETPLTRLDLQTCSCHCASTRTSSSSRGCGSRSAPATPSRAPARAPSVRFAHRSKATAPAARRQVPAEAAHVAQLEGPDCAVAQEEASAQDQVLVRLLADPLARVPCRLLRGLSKFCFLAYTGARRKHWHLHFHHTFFRIQSGCPISAAFCRMRSACLSASWAMLARVASTATAS